MKMVVTGQQLTKRNGVFRIYNISSPNTDVVFELLIRAVFGEGIYTLSHSALINHSNYVNK